MALILSRIELETGIVVRNSYARIESVSGGKLGAEICLRMYVSKEACEGEKIYFKQVPYNFNPSVEDGSDNFIKQGYEHLKTLPEFEGAVDVLE